nr:hypothetical chloroplast RF19 [Utricularia volubilis]
MILKSFLLGNLVSLCMKIIHSVVVVGLYYGFLTTFSIGPSYLFLLRAQVMEEGTEKKVSATTGFLTGQFMIFISIYYAPLHLALGRPHTITVLALPYLLFQFFQKNHKHFFDSGYTTRNSMRNFSIQCVFLNNLIFQLFNHFVLPSSMLARLVKIYMFRCNNKILFVTSSFVGWLIGHILFMKWLGLVLIWIRQKNSISSNVLIGKNKYLVSELRNFLARLFSILLFIICVYYLGRIPSPILTKKLKETPKVEERVEKERADEKMKENNTYVFSEEKKQKKKIEEKIRVNGKKDNVQKIKTLFEESYIIHKNKTLKNSQLKSFYKKREKENQYTFLFEKVLVNVLFDPKRWNRPLRYIETNKFDKAVRNEMSEYFFAISKSGGKETISFTYPTIFAIFLERLKKRLCWFTLEKNSANDLYNSWFYLNKEKVQNLHTDFFNRIQTLDKDYTSFNILELKSQLCNDDSTKKYFSKKHDPLLNGSYRRAKSISASIDQKIKTSFIEKFGINKIYRILLEDPFFQEFEDKKGIFDKFEKKVDIKVDFFDSLIFSKKFVTKPDYIHLNRTGSSLFSKVNPDSNYFVTTDTNGQKNIIIKGPKINKKVPRWLYKLISELEQQSGEHREKVSVDYEIRSRKSKRVVILTTTNKKEDTDPNTTETNTSDEPSEVALIRYSQQPDFRRGLIKGSMRAQRRKIVIWELFQANASSPIFLDRIQKKPPFSFPIYRFIQRIFINWVEGRAFKNVEYIEETNDKFRIEIAETWDTIPFAQVVRGVMLLTQSIFRKYIILPSFILAKNIGRTLLFQRPEWYEDLQEWNREMYVKCTYNAVPLSETEFPKNWLTDGIQIKIVFPFCLKPWHKSKQRSSQKMRIKNTKEKDDFCFLTIWGMESEFPFGSPRKRPSFFKPIFKELKKKKKKLDKNKIIRFLSIKEIAKSREIKVTQKIKNLSPKKISKKLQKGEIIQKGNAQLIDKLDPFFSFLFEKIYTILSFYIINISKMNTELFLEATKKIIDKSISNNQRKQEIIHKKKNNPMPSVSTRKGTIGKSKTNSHIFYDVSYVSQAYVFYKLSQLKKKNSYKIVHQYKGMRPFLKKDSFETQGTVVVDWKVKYNKLPRYQITQWQKWLREYYQYDFSEIKRSGLIPKKRGNRFHQHRITQNDNLSISNRYDEKDQLISFKKQFEISSLSLYSNKENFEKYSNYDILAYKFINYEKESFFSRSYFQENLNQEISSNTPKETLFEMFKNRPIRNFQSHILYMKKSADIKYFDCKIINFDLRQKGDIETWLTTNINRKKKPQIHKNNYKKIPKKSLFFVKFPEINPKKYQKGFFYWMEMNAETLKYGIGNPQLWFFSEFVFISNTYKRKPWFIPSKLLLLTSNSHEINRSENKNINEKSKVLVSSKKNTRNKEENDQTNETDLESVPSQKKDLEENSTRSEGKKIKQYKSKIEAELHFFLKRYLLFQFRGNYAFTKKMISNIKVYCLLLKLMDPKRITLSSIQKRELSLDIMLIQKNLTLKELLKKEFFVIEPIRMSRKKEGRFIMYQTLKMGLVHKSNNNHQTNEKDQEQRYVSRSLLAEPYKGITASIKKKFNLLIPENILSFRRCRTLRILIYFNSKTRNDVERNTLVWNLKSVKNISQVSHDNNDLDTEKNKLMKLKVFLWPNYRLEDLACMNRYWFNTTNGSRLTMLRLQLYS